MPINLRRVALASLLGLGIVLLLALHVL